MEMFSEASQSLPVYLQCVKLENELKTTCLSTLHSCCFLVTLLPSILLIWNFATN